MNTNKHKLKRKQIRYGLIFTGHSHATPKPSRGGSSGFRHSKDSCAFVVDLLQNQHAIAVAVEAIVFANPFLVRAQQKFAAGKRADQHQQRRSWQMEICQQNIDRSKMIRRINEKVARSLLR